MLAVFWTIGCAVSIAMGTPVSFVVWGFGAILAIVFELMFYLGLGDN